MECYCAAARRASRRLVRMYEEELRPAGVNPSQFELLLHISRVRNVTQNELAEAVDLDQTTLSRNLRGMIASGWLIASVHSEDRRVSTYALTKEGATALRKASPLWKRAQTKVSRALRDSSEVRKTLEELIEAAA
jgi:DNA-binding MarR family transcriptional regulator